VSVFVLRVLTIAHACLLGSFCIACCIQHSSSLANRASLVEESAKAKLNARETARLERQRKLAEVLRSKADAEERGEDVERQKNWEWTIEENDAWEKKKARKARRADYEFHGELFLDSSSEHLLTQLALQMMHTQLDGDIRRISISSSQTWWHTTGRKRWRWGCQPVHLSGQPRRQSRISIPKLHLCRCLHPFLICATYISNSCSGTGCAFTSATTTGGRKPLP
jgi:hypothetical protein